MANYDSASPVRAAVRAVSHRHCFVCGRKNPQGLDVEFVPHDDGSVSAVFPCDGAFEGFPGRLHGGIVATLVDGAMTNCLFAHGHSAFTAELNVRYRDAVRLDEPLVVRARLERTRGRLHLLTAEVQQDGAVVVTARAKFLEAPPVAGGAGEEETEEGS